MSEKEQLEYKKETNKRPMYFNKPSNEFKEWLKKKDKKTDELKIDKEELEKQLITQEMEEAIQIVIEEEAIQKSGDLKREKKSLAEFLNVDIKKMQEKMMKEKLMKKRPKVIENCREPTIPMTMTERRQCGAFGMGENINRKEVQKKARKLKLKIWGRKGYGWGVWSDSDANLWIFSIDYDNYDFDANYQKVDFLRFSHEISHEMSKKVDIPLPEHKHYEKII